MFSSESFDSCLHPMPSTQNKTENISTPLCPSAVYPHTPSTGNMIFITVVSHVLKFHINRTYLILVFFFYNLFILFIYLVWAVLGLRCCTQAFSSCGERGATLRCGAWAPHCSGFSCCRPWALGMQASVVAARGLSSCGSRALERRLSSCGARA